MSTRCVNKGVCENCPDYTDMDGDDTACYTCTKGGKGEMFAKIKQGLAKMRREPGKPFRPIIRTPRREDKK